MLVSRKPTDLVRVVEDLDGLNIDVVQKSLFVSLDEFACSINDVHVQASMVTVSAILGSVDNAS